MTMTTEQRKGDPQVILPDPTLHGSISFFNLPQEIVHGQDVTVSYTVDERFWPKLTDWIGLFRAEDHTPNTFSFVSFRWAPVKPNPYLPIHAPGIRTVLFSFEQDFLRYQPVTTSIRYKFFYMHAADSVVAQSDCIRIKPPTAATATLNASATSNYATPFPFFAARSAAAAAMQEDTGSLEQEELDGLPSSQGHLLMTANIASSKVVLTYEERVINDKEAFMLGAKTSSRPCLGCQLTKDGQRSKSSSKVRVENDAISDCMKTPEKDASEHGLSPNVVRTDEVIGFKNDHQIDVCDDYKDDEEIYEDCLSETLARQTEICNPPKLSVELQSNSYKVTTPTPEAASSHNPLDENRTTSTRDTKWTARDIQDYEFKTQDEKKVESRSSKAASANNLSEDVGHGSLPNDEIEENPSVEVINNVVSEKELMDPMMISMLMMGKIQLSRNFDHKLSAVNRRQLDSSHKTAANLSFQFANQSQVTLTSSNFSQPPPIRTTMSKKASTGSQDPSAAVSQSETTPFSAASSQITPTDVANSQTISTRSMASQTPLIDQTEAKSSQTTTETSESSYKKYDYSKVRLMSDYYAKKYKPSTGVSCFTPTFQYLSQTLPMSQCSSQTPPTGSCNSRYTATTPCYTQAPINDSRHLATKPTAVCCTHATPTHNLISRATSTTETTSNLRIPPVNDMGTQTFSTRSKDPQTISPGVDSRKNLKRTQQSQLDQTVDPHAGEYVAVAKNNTAESSVKNTTGFDDPQMSRILQLHQHRQQTQLAEKEKQKKENQTMLQDLLEAGGRLYKDFDSAGRAIGLLQPLLDVETRRAVKENSELPGETLDLRASRNDKCHHNVTLRSLRFDLNSVISTQHKLTEELQIVRRLVQRVINHQDVSSQDSYRFNTLFGANSKSVQTQEATVEGEIISDADEALLADARNGEVPASLEHKKIDSGECRKDCYCMVRHILSSSDAVGPEALYSVGPIANISADGTHQNLEVVSNNSKLEPEPIAGEFKADIYESYGVNDEVIEDEFMFHQLCELLANYEDGKATQEQVLSVSAQGQPLIFPNPTPDWDEKIVEDEIGFKASTTPELLLLSSPEKLQENLQEKPQEKGKDDILTVKQMEGKTPIIATTAHGPLLSSPEKLEEKAKKYISTLKPVDSRSPTTAATVHSLMPSSPEKIQKKMNEYISTVKQPYKRSLVSDDAFPNTFHLTWTKDGISSNAYLEDGGKIDHHTVKTERDAKAKKRRVGSTSPKRDNDRKLLKLYREECKRDEKLRKEREISRERDPRRSMYPDEEKRCVAETEEPWRLRRNLDIENNKVKKPSPSQNVGKSKNSQVLKPNITKVSITPALNNPDKSTAIVGSETKQTSVTPKIENVSENTGLAKQTRSRKRYSEAHSSECEVRNDKSNRRKSSKDFKIEDSDWKRNKSGAPKSNKKGEVLEGSAVRETERLIAMFVEQFLKPSTRIENKGKKILNKTEKERPRKSEAKSIESSETRQSDKVSTICTSRACLDDPNHNSSGCEFSVENSSPHEPNSPVTIAPRNSARKSDNNKILEGTKAERSKYLPTTVQTLLTDISEAADKSTSAAKSIDRNDKTVESRQQVNPDVKNYLKWKSERRIKWNGNDANLNLLPEDAIQSVEGDRTIAARPKYGNLMLLDKRRKLREKQASRSALSKLMRDIETEAKNTAVDDVQRIGLSSCKTISNSLTVNKSIDSGKYVVGARNYQNPNVASIAHEPLPQTQYIDNCLREGPKPANRDKSGKETARSANMDAGYNSSHVPLRPLSIHGPLSPTSSHGPRSPLPHSSDDQATSPIQDLIQIEQTEPNFDAVHETVLDSDSRDNNQKVHTLQSRNTERGRNEGVASSVTSVRSERGSSATQTNDNASIIGNISIGARTNKSFYSDGKQDVTGLVSSSGTSVRTQSLASPELDSTKTAKDSFDIETSKKSSHFSSACFTIPSLGNLFEERSTSDAQRTARSASKQQNTSYSDLLKQAAPGKFYQMRRERSREIKQVRKSRQRYQKPDRNMTAIEMADHLESSDQESRDSKRKKLEKKAEELVDNEAVQFNSYAKDIPGQRIKVKVERRKERGSKKKERNS